MSTKTANFDLTQWTEDDYVNVSEINENFGLIDQLMAQFSTVKSGSYVGTGVYGSSNPNMLTFDHVPLFVIIFDTVYGGHMPVPNLENGPDTAYFRYATSSYGRNQFSWNGTTLSWYCSNYGNALSGSNGSTAIDQLNDSGKTYVYFYF